MSIDTRIHIGTNDTHQNKAVIRTCRVYQSGSAGYRRYSGVAVANHVGDEVHVSLADLGAALRALKIRPADLGYKP